MIVAVGLLLYATVLTWCGSPLLNRITDGGTTPRLGVALWLTAIGGALGSWVAAVTVLVVEAFESSGAALTFCLSALGYASQVGMSPRLGSAASAVLAVAGSVLTAAAARGTLRRMQRLRSSSNQHAQAARIVGRPTQRPGVLVVQSVEPVAYCVAGHPRTIVVTNSCWCCAPWPPVCPDSRCSFTARRRHRGCSKCAPTTRLSAAMVRAPCWLA